MAIKKSFTRSVLAALSTLTLLVCLGWLFLPHIKEGFWSYYNEFVRDPLQNTQKIAIRNNLLLERYTLVEEYPAAKQSSDSTLIFVGHIYPRNEFLHSDEIKPMGPDRPLVYLTKLVNISNPARIIFGGDNVYKPTEEALEHLLKVKLNFPKNSVRLLLGNHDDYWNTLSKKPNQLKLIYGKRYFFEDISGVRLIYIHTIQQHGRYGIDKEQIDFLRRILNPLEYRYALVFQHHALWTGDTLHANSRYDDAKNLKQFWITKILPILKAGSVKAVFSGDGGWRRPGRSMRINGISHYITGWTWRLAIPSEWLTIELKENSPKVMWHKYFEGDHYSKNETKRVNFGKSGQ